MTFRKALLITHVENTKHHFCAVNIGNIKGEMAVNVNNETVKRL